MKRRMILWLASALTASGQILYHDDFEQLENGTDLTSTNYIPASGPSSASAVTSVQNGMPTITATNFLGSTWTFFDNSIVTNKNQYKGLLSTVQTNQPLRITWKMWIQATNTGSGAFLFSVPVQDSDPEVTFNPPLAFMDNGAIVALTNGTSVQTPIGNWGSLAGTVMTNALILDYPNHPNRTFSYSINGQTVATLPLGPYFTNVVGAIYFNGFERSAGSLGNRFAIDDVKVEMLALSGPTPSFQWAKRVASTINPDDELSIGLAIDSAANLYATGWFDGTNDFGGVTLTNKSGGGQDIFVAKFDSLGALRWAQSAGGDTGNLDAGRGIGVDNAGNVYVTGGFHGNADFGGWNLSGTTRNLFFLAKYDNNGTVQWVRQSEGGRGVYGTGLAVDSAGNCHAVGYANNGASFTFGTTNLLHPGFDGYSAFLVKYDSGGNVQWAQLLGSPERVYATKVAVDAAGKVYVRGSFNQELTIENNSLVSVGGRDLFIAKFDASGALAWVRQEGGSGDDGNGGVAVDQAGNVHVSGAFGSNPINLQGTSLTNAGGGDALLAKYNASGEILWARRAGGTELDFWADAALDRLGNVYVGGFLSFGAMASGGSGATVAKYDSNGTLQWSVSASGTPASPVASVVGKCAVDSAGNCYLAGWYQTPATFGGTVLQPQGQWNYFLAKVGFTPLTLGIEWSDSMPRLSVSGEVGSRFALEYISVLALTNRWQSLGTNTLISSPLILPDTSTTGTSSRFYRAWLVP